jgi:hypothetical protein
VFVRIIKSIICLDIYTELTKITRNKNKKTHYVSHMQTTLVEVSKVFFALRLATVGRLDPHFELSIYEPLGVCV